MILRIVLYLVLSGFSYAATIKWSIDFKYEDYKDYLTLISGVSGMVFTIMGIWIAFLYPNAMSHILSPDKVLVADYSESKSDAKRLESIVGAVLASALVMIIALLITFAKLVIFHMPVYEMYRLEIKATALAVLVFITLAQLESVVYVVLSNIMFINDLHWKRQSRQADEEL